MKINSIISRLERRRDLHLNRLTDLTSKAVSAGVANTGTSAFDSMAETRWQIGAVDYVLSGFEDGITEENFLAVFEGIQRDLISAGQRPDVMHRDYAPAYWKELGLIERDMRLEAEHLKNKASA